MLVLSGAEQNLGSVGFLTVIFDRNGIFQAEKMFERFRPVSGCQCKQLLPIQQLRRQQRHGAGDYFPDSLKGSTIWGFRYQALQSNYRALFAGWNEVLWEVVHPTSCLASRIVVKAF